MLDFKGFLCKLSWFQKVFELAETIPPNTPAPWQNELAPGEVIVTTVPEDLRNIIVADFILNTAKELEIIQHANKHDDECSFACPFIIEIVIQHNERILLNELLNSILARSLVHTEGIPSKILSDWRIVAKLELDPFENFSEETMPPPSEEEKKYAGS